MENTHSTNVAAPPSLPGLPDSEVTKSIKHAIEVFSSIPAPDDRVMATLKTLNSLLWLERNLYCISAAFGHIRSQARDSLRHGSDTLPSPVSNALRDIEVSADSLHNICAMNNGIAMDAFRLYRTQGQFDWPTGIKSNPIIHL